MSKFTQVSPEWQHSSDSALDSETAFAGNCALESHAEKEHTDALGEKHGDRSYRTASGLQG